MVVLRIPAAELGRAMIYAVEEPCALQQPPRGCICATAKCDCLLTGWKGG